MGRKRTSAKRSDRRTKGPKVPVGSGRGTDRRARSGRTEHRDDDLFGDDPFANDPLDGDHPSGGAAALAGGLGAKVLVLNKLYLAVRVVSARRAFSLLVRDLAEVLSVEDGHYNTYDFSTWAELSELRASLEREEHDWVRTVRSDIAVPRIIRLLGYDRLPEQQVKLNRRNLFARDRNRCQYCGHHFPTSELSIDHVLPKTQGGGDAWDNLVCSCVRCNARKGGRTPAQASMALIRKPVRPRRNPLITMRLHSPRYQSWKQFLENAYWSVELK